MVLPVILSMFQTYYLCFYRGCSKLWAYLNTDRVVEIHEYVLDTVLNYYTIENIGSMYIF